MNKKLVKILVPVLCVVALLLGFFVPFAISKVGEDKDNEAGISKNAASIVSNIKNWKFSNSYSAQMYNKKTVKDNIRKILDIDSSNYEIKICDYNQKNDDNFLDILELPSDPFNPQIVYKFQYVVAYKNRIVLTGKVNNMPMLEKALKGIAQINYLDLFNISQSGDSNVPNEIAQNLSTYILKNDNKIIENIKKDNLGDETDIPNLFKFLANAFSVNYDDKKFSINSDEVKDMLDYLIKFDFPQGYKITNNFESGTEFPYFVKQDATGGYYFHDKLGLPHDDNEEHLLNPKIKLTNTSTVKDLKLAFSSVLSQYLLKDSNLSAIEEDDADTKLLNVRIMLSSTPGSGEFPDTRTVKSMWGGGTGFRHAWIWIDGLSDEGKKFSPLLKLDNSKVVEHIQFKVVFDEGGNK